MRYYSPCRIFHDNSLLLNFFLPKFVTKILGKKKKKEAASHNLHKRTSFYHKLSFIKIE